MARRKRLVTAEQEAEILRAIEQRNGLRDKALARRYGLSLRSLQCVISRLRPRARLVVLDTAEE